MEITCYIEIKYIKKFKDILYIMEAQFRKFLNFDGYVVWWSPDGSINSQESNTF